MFPVTNFLLKKIVFRSACHVATPLLSFLVCTGAPSFRLYCSVPWKWGDKGFAETFAHLKNDQLHDHKGKFVSLPQLYHARELAKGIAVQDCRSFF